MLQSVPRTVRAFSGTPTGRGSRVPAVAPPFAGAKSARIATCCAYKSSIYDWRNFTVLWEAPGSWEEPWVQRTALAAGGAAVAAGGTAVAGRTALA